MEDAIGGKIRVLGIKVKKVSSYLETEPYGGVAKNGFLNCAAEVLPKYIRPRTAEVIYLNFSNPLPKEGYKKQRLTHPRFLKIYRALLKDGGVIIQKTDDGDFFGFSLESYRGEGFEILYECRDYDCGGDDVQTEHEKKFKEQGKKIYRVIAGV